MTARPGRLLHMAYLAASVAGVAFFIMSVALLGIWPGRVLERQVRAMSPEHPLGLTVSEERGRAIYSREGCAYCYTQQVRYVHADVMRFGAPTSRGTRGSTFRTSGAPGGSGPTWRARDRSGLSTGTMRTSLRRARSSPIR